MTKTQMIAAKQALVAAGWTHTHSVMAQDGTANFGLCFIKDGKKFYLNVLTFKNLPI